MNETAIQTATETETETASPAAPAGWDAAPTATEDNPPAAGPQPAADAPAVSPPAEVARHRLLLLPKNLEGLAKLTADGSSAVAARYPTAGVRLEALPGNRYRAEVTDGRHLVRVEGAHDNPDDFPAWPELDAAPNGATSAVIPSGPWAAAFKSIPKVKRWGKPILFNVAAVMGENVVTLASTDLETPNLSQPRQLEGRWPDSDKVFPKGQPAVTVELDALRLAKLLQAAAAFSPDGQPGRVTVEVRRDGKPLVVRASNGTQTLTALLMPLS